MVSLSYRYPRESSEKPRPLGTTRRIACAVEGWVELVVVPLVSVATVVAGPKALTQDLEVACILVVAKVRVVLEQE